MEVAGQWRREWAGTAEYGKVTEGGVTRRVARAMEVLHASAPGARVRVMRAAYHSTAGPGAPAASFMLHSSRRVISSGSSFLESPTFMTKPLDSPTYITKPLEISSLPLESSPERFSEAEDYKVTEPDDLDISEPSKWRSSAARPAPSEDSSSADTASLIEQDSRLNGYKHTNSLRKHSFDSDNSEVHTIKKPVNRLSPLLDAPVTLSTLKYKSLLNGTRDNWTDRRKSYSFEDTSPLSETLIHCNDTLAMESSTDSGICKSTELVDDNTEESNSPRYSSKDNINTLQEGSFKEWLARNRASNIRRESPLKSYRGSKLEELNEDKVSLQSPGKVSITIPMNNKTDDKFQYTKNHANEEADRRTKKVEFCKTELHFAAESGTVNIIATDEKPPPSNDFRRRRSAFVPIKGNFDKPITLFGDRVSEQADVENYEIGEKNETNEYGLSTKSILKNKIPKPKPYLLGENMSLDDIAEPPSARREFIIPTTVSLINKQLQPEERKYVGLPADKVKQSMDIAAGVRNYHASRTTNYGSETTEASVIRKNETERKLQAINKVGENKHSTEDIQPAIVKKTLKHLETSPVLQAKTRPLRDSDLTYFGVHAANKTRSHRTKTRLRSLDSDSDDYFKSVKLIQQVSNSVCNSEAESEDHDYQNLPFQNTLSPVPVPKPRKRVTQSDDFMSKDYYDTCSPDDAPGRVRIIKPVIEEDNSVEETRRSRATRQEVTTKTTKSRSISEPPKHRMAESVLQSSQEKRRKETLPNGSPLPKSRKNTIKEEPKIRKRYKLTEEVEIPLYANLSAGNKVETKQPPVPSRRSVVKDEAEQANSTKPEDKLAPVTATERGAGSLSSKTKIRKQSDEQHFENLHQKSVDNVADKVIKSRNKPRERSSSRNQTESTDRTSTATAEDKRSTAQKHDIIRSSTRRHHARGPADDKKGDVRKERKTTKESVRNIDRSTDVRDDERHAKTKRRGRSKSTDKEEPNKDTTETVQSTLLKAQKNPTDGDTHRANSKRNEYVINYDDKNGTVSSICKVSTGPQKKKTNKEKYNEYPKEPRTNAKSADKRSLLEYQDRHWIQNGYSHADRKWKDRLPVQRTCQIL